MAQRAQEAIYLPGDDSFLLMQELEIPKDALVLDMGCGTGIQGISALKRGAKECLFVDSNKAALEHAKRRVPKKFLKKSRFVQSNLFAQVQETFDIIIFNPPYVPSEKIRWKDTDGGKQGREIIDQFLKQVQRHLKKKGHLYFVQSSLNGIKKTQNMLAELGLKHKIACRKKLFFEELVVIVCWKA